MKTALLIALGLSLGTAAANVMLSRVDRAQQTAEAARAETRLLRAEVAQRDLKPVNTAPDPLTAARIETLRRVVYTLVGTATRWPMFASLPSLDPALYWPRLPTLGWDLRVEPMRVVGGEP